MSEKVTFKETVSVHYRAYKIIHKYCPGAFLVRGLYYLIKSVSVYVTIYLSAQVINELSSLCRKEELVRLVILTLVISGSTTLLTGILKHYSDYYGEKLERRLNRLSTDKLFSLDFEDVDNVKTHDLLSQIKQSQIWAGWGIYSLYYDAFGQLVEALSGMLSAITLTISLFIQKVPENSSLAFLNRAEFVILVIIALLAATIFGANCKNKATSYLTDVDDDARLGNRIFSAFGFGSYAPTRSCDIRIYHQQDYIEYYLTNCDTFTTKGRWAKLSKTVIGYWSALGASISSILSGFIYMFVCLKGLAGAFGIGSITQYISSLTTLASNLSALLVAFGTLKANVPFMNNLYKFLDIPNKMYQGSLTTEKRSDKHYEIEFKDVSFKYPNSEQYALHHVNMKFKVGKRLAIVGENGSGKTTFIKLLCRLYDPTEGEILLNGINIRKYSYADYINLFSIVFQDFQLIAQPLADNVAGSDRYDKEKVMKALQEAGAAEFVGKLKNGLDTMLYKELSDEGVDLSGGEAQKIAIARALYKDAPFIILDEPTAALDPIAEAEIYSKFNEISGDRTSVYISHRLSSCRFCDEIAVFDQGKVIQQGSHEQLLEDEKGKYFSLWHAQAQYYIES